MINASYRSPKTECRKSPISGKGRFAKENIHKGEILTIRSGHIVDGNHVQRHSDIIHGSEHQIADDFYLAPLSEEEFHAVMCYVNHSCTPNAGILGNVIVVAMRDIAAGEEICLDYAMLFSNDKQFNCMCGSKKCRGIVSGKDWMKKDLQESYKNYFSTYLHNKINGL